MDKQLKPCISAGLSAAVYTHTMDVKIEVNGYVTYDREVEKMDFEKVKEAYRVLEGMEMDRQAEEFIRTMDSSTQGDKA
jgi:hypothetical protein